MLTEPLQKGLALTRKTLGSCNLLILNSLGVKPKGLRILCYHKVSGTTRDYVTVSTEEFRKQMNYLKKEGYQTVGLEYLVNGSKEAPRGKEDTNTGISHLLPNASGSREIIITFDDGFSNNYENAFPILKEAGFTATIFCTGNAIGNERFSAESSAFGETEEFLNEKQIEEMREYGIEIGSHTLTHPRLRGLSSAEKKGEILSSKLLLEKKLKSEIKYFCYPYGEFDAETVDLVKESGYLAACSNIPGGNKKRDGLNPYLLKRTEVSGFDDLREFEKKINGAYDGLHSFLHWVRGRP